jgi:hypothetical protein
MTALLLWFAFGMLLGLLLDRLAAYVWRNLTRPLPRIEADR